eukprot:s433_g4.t1
MEVLDLPRSATVRMLQHFSGGYTPFSDRQQLGAHRTLNCAGTAWNGVNLSPARCKQFLQDLVAASEGLTLDIWPEYANIRSESVDSGQRHPMYLWYFNKDMDRFLSQADLFRKTQYAVDLVDRVSLMAQSVKSIVVVVTCAVFLVKMLLVDGFDRFGYHGDHSAPMQVQSQMQSPPSFSSTPPSSPSSADASVASVVRDCEHLFEESNCDFDVEPGRKFDCRMEQLSRFVFTMWLRPGAKVLEVGARYGHASCQLAKVLGLNGTHGDGAKQVSVDADPLVWDILEKNLADHKCDVQVVRGTIGSKSYKLVTPQANSASRGKEQYGSFVADLNDSHNGTVIPAHSVRSLNLTFDTLAIDCEGCFATFLDENPELLESVTMIILELHDLQRLKWMLQRPDRVSSSEDQVVANLMKNGWELKHSIDDHRVLCKGPCVNFCDLEWVERQRKRYSWKVVNPKK